MENIPLSILISAAAVFFIIGGVLSYNFGRRAYQNSEQNKLNRFPNIPGNGSEDNNTKTPERIIDPNKILLQEKEEKEENQPENQKSEIERMEPKFKFLKYTSQGYVNVEDDKKNGLLKWR